MTARRADHATVELLYAFTGSTQTDQYDPDDHATWTVRGRLMLPEEVELVLRATVADFDALDALLAVDRALLAVTRADVADRLRAVGLHELAGQLPELQ